MAKFYSTQLFLVFLIAFLVSSIEGFSPSVGLGPQVRTIAPPTELWGKKKKKKNKNKKKGRAGGDATVAVLEPPAAVAEEEAAPVVVVKEPVVADLEDPAATMIANEMFHRELLAQKLAYDSKISEAPEVEEVEPIAEPVAVAVEPEPEPEPVDLAAKYAAIDDVGERAYVMLKDLGMFD